MSRRDFLAASACGIAASAIASSAFSTGAFAAERAAATSQSRRRLQSFTYRDVKLTAGPLKEQFDSAFAFFMKLDDDRLLQPYRAIVGLPTDAKPMGGWYDMGAFAPGHTLGQWISALSRFANATGDTAARDKVASLVGGLGEVLAAKKSFYDGHRFKAYVFDKHVIGLNEAFSLAQVSQARDVLARATDLAVKVLPEKALTRQEMAQRPHKDITYTWDESYTLPENLFIAADIFGDSRYLALAQRYLHDKPFYEPLAAGHNALIGQHAYSHMNCLSSAARAYLSLGDDMHLRAARNGWDFVLAQSFASGGWGPNETFIEPGKGKLFESLTGTHNHFETPCGSYAHFKLARYLMAITADSRYGDSLERVLYNGILAAKAPQPDGSAFYYSDYHAQGRKTYFGDKWPCCSGTYPQVIADYLLSMYFQDGQGIYVNLYAPSELTWAGVTLTQTTDYPQSDRVTCRLSLREGKSFPLHFRIPAWAKSATIRINADPPTAAQAGSFATLDRTWRDGDTVELTLPMRSRTEAIDEQHPQTIALLRGPVMFVAVPQPLSIARDAIPADPAAHPVHAGDIRFVPFHSIGDESYTTYFTQA